VQSTENLKKVYLKNFRGELVPLTEVVEVQEATGYQVLNRYNRQYSFSFFANLLGEKSLADAVAELEGWLRANLPPGYTFEATGQAKEFARSSKGSALPSSLLWWAFIWFWHPSLRATGIPLRCS
jgi:HAE1 family hydrophobic/amphiphilic exporter-1